MLSDEEVQSICAKLQTLYSACDVNKFNASLTNEALTEFG